MSLFVDDNFMLRMPRSQNFFIILFLSRVSTAMLTRDIDMAILSFCPSVCLSRSGIVLKGLNVSSYFLQHVADKLF